MINIVTIGGRKYHVDVGFGPNGLVAPMPINHDELVLDGIAPATHRLVYKNIEENTDPDQRLWVLQHRNDDSSSWTDLYCYTLLEFIAADFRK
ncbi:MAG: arylamine N-acetyltransferase [Terriglobus roseus]|nr:arylamine N-acetyltransferase [Terriglobus roseus]